MRNEGNRHFRNVAGNLELFLGAYFVAFGILAVLFFSRTPNRTGIMASSGSVLFGTLLVLRARRLLPWHRWVFWTVTLLIIAVPIAWLLPAVVSFKR
jgi:hypothetical protein